MAHRRALSQSYTRKKGINGGLTLFSYWKGGNLERISERGASNNFAAQGNIEHLLHDCKT